MAALAVATIVVRHAPAATSMRTVLVMATARDNAFIDVSPIAL
jgi:hypothetical protein